MPWQISHLKEGRLDRTYSVSSTFHPGFCGSLQQHNKQVVDVIRWLVAGARTRVASAMRAGIVPSEMALRIACDEYHRVDRTKFVGLQRRK